MRIGRLRIGCGQSLQRGQRLVRSALYKSREARCAVWAGNRSFLQASWGGGLRGQPRGRDGGEAGREGEGGITLKFVAPLQADELNFEGFVAMLVGEEPVVVGEKNFKKLMDATDKDTDLGHVLVQRYVWAQSLAH